MPDLFFLIFGIVVGITGLPLLLVELYSLIVCRERVEAKVVDFKVQSNIIRGSVIHMFSPILEYEVDGKPYTGVSPFSSRFEGKYPIDSTLVIYVSKKNPENYRFEGRFGSLIAGSIITAISALFIVLYFI